MPKVKALTPEQKIAEAVEESTDKLNYELHKNKISYTKIANLLDVTPAAVAAQFSKGRISYPVYVTANMLLKGKIE